MEVVEGGLTTLFSADLVSNGLTGRVVYFFARKTMVRTTMMTMTTIAREMRMIEEVDRDFTTNES